MSMILTRSAARALLTNRATVDNDKFPEDVLLEIFDAYRQLHEHQPDYEKVWNSRDGWFKLAHVCLHWRRVVLLSPSRLHVHLLFTPRRSPTEPMLKCLPLLPILVDFRHGPWTKEEEDLALAAIKHRSRVRKVVLRRPYTKQHMAKLLRALSHPFPELENLEIFPPDDRKGALILPATFLSGSASCLRRLMLRDVLWSCLSPLLSSATGLVELTLTVRVAYSALPDASFIANLQRMSRLRRLEVQLKAMASTPININPQPPTGAKDIITLPELMQLVYTGHRPYLEALVAVLTAPSLQNLNIAVGSRSLADDFPIPHLCRFIRDTDNQFITIRLDFSRWRFKFSAGTGSQSVHNQHFSMTIPAHVSLEQLGRELSGSLSTVEELIIGWQTWTFERRSIQPDQMRGFYHYLPQVKIVQVPAGVALDVARSFKGDGGLPLLYLLPALERIEVRSAAGEDDTQSGVDKLPEDVLLEIFDAYRQLCELQSNYEKVWNSSDGWFKLAHACLYWRRVVSDGTHVEISSPPFRFWSTTAMDRGRKRKRISHSQLSATVVVALSHPFPELESLDIFPTDDRNGELVLPATFLSDSAPCLRRLMLRDVLWSCLSPLLSSATGLVELTLTVKIAYSALPDASFIANLQHMSRLRRLELELKFLLRSTTNDDPRPPTGVGDIVPLPELMRLTYTGHRRYFEALVAVLAAPSLQHLDVGLMPSGVIDRWFPHSAPLQLKFSAGTGSQPVLDQPFLIVDYDPFSLEQLGRELSGPLSTVEELVVGWEPCPTFSRADCVDFTTSRK
ncbi:hypothetical protein EDB87DRAFT_1830497 [Lactarius vividus]|nr:hypothetical protein EDB87DRAFT_1830497 [Lactarius vividus]